MTKLFKKLISQTVLIGIVLQLFPIYTIFASFSVNTFTLNGNHGPSFYLNPGDSFSIDSYATNDTGEDIQNVVGKIAFGNNSNFSYSGNDQATAVQFVNVFDPIPSSDYSSSTGLSTSISNNTVGNGEYIMILRKTGNFTGFTINNDASNYSDSITVSFDANKVSDNSLVTGNTQVKSLFINVKPHITDKYFSKSGSRVTTIAGNNAEQLDFFIEVKDYNGCNNIDGGTITADLSKLGLQSSETLIYDSCKGDGKTAVFKKTAISTVNPLGDINFNYTDFSATDEDGNSIDPNDSNFAEATEKYNFTLTVVSPGAPTIDTLTLSDNYIGGSGQLSTTLSYSSTQSGTSKVLLDSCSNTDPAKIFQTSQSYTGTTTENVTINSSALTEGDNTVFVCIDNGLGDEGSSNVILTKDTQAPSISNITNTANITTQDLSVNFICNEDGEYQVTSTQSGSIQVIKSYTSTNKDTLISESFNQSLFPLGINTLDIYCRDNAGNIASAQRMFTKHEPTPSMLSEVVTLVDGDIDNNGLDGLDIHISWATSVGQSFSGFDSWRVFLLPDNVTLDSENQTEIFLNISVGSGSFIGTSSLTKDSTGTDLVGGGSYKAHVFILGQSGEKGVAGESNSVALIADTIEQATVTSAEFISNDKLKLYTDTTLDTATGSHNANLISYKIGGTTKTTHSVDSVDGQNIIFNIENLNNTATTGTDLVILAGALHSQVGGFNLELTPSLTIADKQNPIISSFTQNNSASFGTFFQSPINVTWNSSELLTSGNTFLNFQRTSGNLDSTPHKINITGASELSQGSHTRDVIINSATNSNEVSLNCGTTYKLSFQAEDSAGNTTTSQEITNISFDNCAPEKPTLNEKVLEGESDIIFTWNTPTDDNGNGSGIKNYLLEIYSDNTCTNVLSTNDTINGTTFSTNLVNDTYSWRIKARDNMDNLSDFSDCDTFDIDSDIPTFANQAITDVPRSDTAYLKNGNNVSITANILNTNISNISADLSALTGNASDTSVICNSPRVGISCSYVGDLLTYSFITGFDGITGEGTRQIQLSANNTSGINNRTDSFSITLDSNIPTIDAGALTFPNGGETIGGTNLTITWDITKVSDVIGLERVEISYLKAGVSQGIICSDVNNGSCLWDTSSLTTASDYKVQIEAFDQVGNSNIVASVSNFGLDKTLPSVPSNTITSPNSGILAGGETINITWDNSLVTDTNGLATNPITLELSSDNGSNYTNIITDITNNGTYSWVIPSINTNQNIIKLTAKDAVGNINSDQSDNSIIIDSITPALDILFAGNGGNTPQNGKYVNNSGLNLTLTSSDNYLDRVYYTFENKTDSTYWNGSSYTGTIVENILCSDDTVLGTGNNCNSITQNITPIIEDTKLYRLVFFSIDEAGNLNTSNPIDYTGDLIAPTLGITTQSGSYASSNINIAGTSSDADSGISSVNISIKKGSEYWNGSSFVNNIESLLTSTSDNYTNWTYDFNIPNGDSEDQEYEIIITSTDNAFKINNSTVDSIIIKKDSQGPVIQSNTIITPTTGDNYSGGDNINISWNTGNISDSLSGLGATPIKLEYFNGLSYNLIIDNLANSGTYTWNNIPSIDTSNANIRITASDITGNTSFQNSQSFIIDSTDPSISSIETLENNISDGTINALKVIFSEDINDATLSASDFSINGDSITINSITTGASGNDREILLLFTPTGDTSTRPTLRYTGTSIEDLVGRKLAPTGTLNSIDKATPRVQSIEMFDINTNGKLDKIEISYSESLNSDNSIGGFNLSNALSGMNIVSSSIVGNTIHLTLSESDEIETATADFQISLSSPTQTDTSGNVVEAFNNRNLTDKALPIKISTSTLDTNDNNKADIVRLIYSENMNSAIVGDFSSTNLSNGSTLNTATISGKNVNLGITETSDINDTDNNIQVSYIQGTLEDLIGNKADSLSSHLSTDRIEPYIISSKTIDVNGNGKIETIEVITSENLDDNFTGVNYSISGYTVNSISTGVNADNKFLINLTEKEVTDSNITPTIQLLSNTSLSDSSANSINIDSVPLTTDDGVGPVIINARYDKKSSGTADDTIYITFSEAIDQASIDQTTGGPLNDFTILNGGAIGAGGSISIISPTEVSIILGAGATELIPGTSQIGIKTSALSDILGNISPIESSLNRIVLSASVVINEIMFNDTLQYIELRNLGSTSIDISNWYIENAEGNGSSLVISSGTIPGNGYFLISNLSAGSSLLQITPDLIDNGLSLNSVTQNNLVLRNSSTIFDTIESSPWPAGNNSTPKAMERSNNPGNGLDISNWYSSEASVGFDNTTIKGTPKAANVLDAVAPTITKQFPLDNTLLPTSGHISFEYNDDNVGVNGSTASLNFQKWNGSSYDTINTDILTTQADDSKAHYTLKDLSAGRYKATFQISDNAGNTLTKDLIFYIDRFSAKITNNQIDLGDITSGGNNFSVTEATIEIKTLGSDFTIQQSKSGLFSQGTISIIDYDGTFGFGNDIFRQENGVTNNYNNSLSAINNSQIVNNTSVDFTDGVLKNYTYKIKFGTQIGGMQEPGKYTAQMLYNIDL